MPLVRSPLCLKNMVTGIKELKFQEYYETLYWRRTLEINTLDEIANRKYSVGLKAPLSSGWILCNT